MKKTTNRLLSTLLALLMVFALLPAFEIGVFAEDEPEYYVQETETSKKIPLETNVNVDYVSWSWKMCGTRGLLTLSGCTLYRIALPCDADVFLVGNNEITYENFGGIFEPSLSGKNIVIDGSGRLEAANIRCGSLTVNGGILHTNLINTFGNFTLNYGLIESKYILVYANAQGKDSDLTVNGGAIVLHDETGYATGVKINVLTGKCIVNGGYLDTGAANDDIMRSIYAGSFVNNGGVAKIEGNDYGIQGNATFNGGVTVIKVNSSDEDDIAVTGTITTANGEKLYADDLSAEIALDTDGKTEAKYLVAAKSVVDDKTAAALELDGTYVKSCSGEVYSISVSGGNYVDCGCSSSAPNNKLSITGDGLLVFGGNTYFYFVDEISEKVQMVGLSTLSVCSGVNVGDVDRYIKSPEIICLGDLYISCLNIYNNIIFSTERTFSINNSIINGCKISAYSSSDTTNYFKNIDCKNVSITLTCKKVNVDKVKLTDCIYSCDNNGSVSLISPYQQASLTYDHSTGAVMTGLPDGVALQWYDPDEKPVDEDKLEIGKPYTLRTTCANAYAIYGVDSYVPPDFDITLDPCGGVCDVSVIKVGYNKAIGELPTPTYEGHRFTGWFLADGVNMIGAETEFTGPETLYAHWYDIPVITLDPNGGDGEKTEISVGDDNKLSKPLPTPNRDGYKFLGWFLADGTQVDETTVFAESATIFAHWEKIPYSPALVFTASKLSYPRIITDPSGVSIYGQNISRDALLKVVELDLTSAGSFRLASLIKYMGEKDVLAAYDLQMTAHFYGSIKISVKVDASYNGKAVDVLYMEGEYATYRTVTVKDGFASIELSYLSPIVVLG